MGFDLCLGLVIDDGYTRSFVHVSKKELRQKREYAKEQRNRLKKKVPEDGESRVTYSKWSSFT